MSSIKRPSSFDSIVGQSDVVTRLRISTEGCKKSNSVLPHVLIDGPPGLGKTTMAGAIATEMEVNLYTTNAVNLRSVKSVLPYLTYLQGRIERILDAVSKTSCILATKPGVLPT